MCLSYDQREYDFLNNFEYIWNNSYLKKKKKKKRAIEEIQYSF